MSSTSAVIARIKESRQYVWDAGQGDWIAMTQTQAGANTGLTNDELRAADVKVTLDGEQVAISNFPATQPVSVAATVNVKEARATTPAQSSVNDSASSVTLLASNANRLGATIYNDSTAILYLKLGATASATSFTVKLSPDGYYEVPFGYTGIIDGIWASDASGAARITELTA